MPRYSPLATLLGSLVLATSLVPAPGEASMAEHALRQQGAAVQPAPVLWPSTASPGAPVRVKGRLGTHLIRKVVLQRKAGSIWRRVSGATTDPSGRYRIAYAAPAATTRLRVKAPAFDKRGRHYRQLVTAAANLRVQPSPAPTAVLELPHEVQGAGPASDAVVRTTNVAAGTSVILQRRTGTTWHDVAARPADSSGVARVPFPVGQLGTGTAALRAVVPGFGPTPAGTVDVLPPGTILEPAVDEAFDGSFDVTVEVDATLAPSRVQLYVDGFVMPDAQQVAGQPRHWAATLDPVAAGVGRRHVDVVARVTTDDGSALTEPVRLDLLPSPGGVPAGFRIDTVASGFDLPTSFAVIDEHRVLVAEKAGLVRLAVDGVIAPSPVLDLRDTVADVFDAGLLDIVLDPDFAENGWFYVSFVADDGGADVFRTQRVARYTLTDGVADPSSVHVVLGAVPLATCKADATTPGCLLNWQGMHTVDDLLFAPDGSLFVSVGDGSPADPTRALAAQSLDVLAGKVLRIDPETGLGVPANPYYQAGTPGSNRSRVYAYGFRNPFRLAQSPAGDLYVGDVGEVLFEEIDKVVAGGNYGWPCFEGESPGTAPNADQCDAITHQLPLLAYGHFNFQGSVTLGVFAEGSAYPTDYQGLLFLGDYTQGRVWTLDVADPERLVDFGVPPGLGAGVAYGLGPEGDIWYSDISSGSIRRIVYDPAQTSCPSDRYLMETFSNRDFEPEPDGDAWVSSCVGSIPSGPSLTAPGAPNQGEGWAMRWTGTPQLAPGTYVLEAKSSGSLVVKVDGTVVSDGGSFTVAGTDVGESTAQVQVSVTNNPAWDANLFYKDYDELYALSWRRVGHAPVVRLHDVGQGGVVAPGSTVGWTVAASDAEDGPIDAGHLRVAVMLLHYGTGSPHGHPSGTYAGASGSTVLDDDHAPGKIAYRLVGVATDSSGWVAESDPVYVCLDGGEVGPCG
jgi:glucose/arabinose dehydrogenase